MNEDISVEINSVSANYLSLDIHTPFVKINHTLFEHSPGGSSVRIDYSPMVGHRAVVNVPLSAWLTRFGKVYHEYVTRYSNVLVTENTSLAVTKLRHD